MVQNWFLIVIGAFLICLASCSITEDNDGQSEIFEQPLFSYLSSQTSGVDFINKVEDQEDFNILSYRNFYNGGGVGVGDFNNDGLNDLYFTANMGPNKLYINKGKLQFEDATANSGAQGKGGWCTGVSIIDINADGFMDIYVSNSGYIDGESKDNELFINNGDLTFTERAKEYNLDNEGFTTHAAFFDYDGDGDLDCYILNNSFKDPSRIDLYSRTREENDPLGGDKLMRNDGDTFTDVTAEAGIYSSAIGFGLGVSIGDLNNDLWPDLYISNDFWERDYLYINNQDGTFSEELTDQMSLCSVSSMGADIGDINNDGYPDIFSTDMLAADNRRLKAATVFDPYHVEDLKYRSSYHYQILQNCLHINRNGESFREVASLSGVSATDWSWGALLFDFDNNGLRDIFVSNGIYHDIMDLDFANFVDDKDEVKKIVTEKGRYDFRDFLEFLPSNPLDNYAFYNQGALQFKNLAQELGFKKGEFSNGAAYADLDNDGDYEVIINNINETASIYNNHSDQLENHYISINLKGEGTNPNAIGSKIIVETDDRQVMQEVYLNRGFQSSISPRVNIGLGDASSINRITVIWPDRTFQTIENPPIDISLHITKEDTRPYQIDKSQESILTDVSDDLIKGNSRHKENSFNDFDHELLLPRMHSTEGPRLASADVNGDGLEDFITLGAQDDSDKLFIQQKDGSFKISNESNFVNDAAFESTTAAFFDSDQDGDKDLIIGAGGNQLAKGVEGFLLRYYENDGKGNFINIPFKSPQGAGQVSVIAPYDFDSDGDMDVFIGGRSIPGNYGLIPRSFLFRNDGGGQWTDVTTETIGTAGMVTDAEWVDTDEDGDKDLLLVGEWMPVTTIINDNGSFTEKNEIANSNGWWLSITSADIDGDSKSEFVLGNWGLNSKFKASKDKPLTMYVNDFDKNGKTEFIINWYPPLENQAFPFSSKDDLTKQLPQLRKEFFKYEDYADATYEDLFKKEQAAGATRFDCYTLHSAILNFSEGGPTLKELPVEAQIAPLFAAAALDYNKDGKQDLWVGGNFHGLKPEAGHMDASRGVLLKNMGDFRFEEVLHGDLTKGEVRDAIVMNQGTENEVLLIARNNMPIQALKY